MNNGAVLKMSDLASDDGSTATTDIVMVTIISHIAV